MNPDKANTKQLFFYFQKSRLIKIFWAIQAIMLIIACHRFIIGAQYQGLHLLVMMLLLTPVYQLAQRNKNTQAATYLLCFLTAYVSFYMWAYSGLLDETVFLYPCILSIAAMIGSRRLFIYLASFIFISVAANGFVNHIGVYINGRPKIDINFSISLIFFLLISGYISWIICAEFSSILNKLRRERQEAINAKVEVEKLLNNDRLTGLPNRTTAREIFLRALFRAQNNDQQVGILYLDIDKFKYINKELGQQAGDILLIQMAKRINQAINENENLCRLCRLASDEFLIIVEAFKSNQCLAKLGQEILDATQRPFSYAASEYTISCSIGVCVVPDNGKEYDQIISNADKAVNFSKSTGGNSFHFYDQDMNEQGHQYLSVVNDLRKAIKEKQFFLTFQPKVDLRNKQVYGVEALIRWQHPVKGLIPPDHFIPQAEQSGIIVEIGNWVVNEACKTCRSWLKQGIQISIAVNVSSKQFQRKNFYDSIKLALANNQLPAHLLELEMTESLLIDNTAKLKNTIESLHQLGVKFSIDDFGTGYSNLAYLKKFDIEYLKIDRSFVTDLQNNPQNQTLVRAIIQLAHGLGIEAIAEGIEDQDTATLLSLMQCNYAQGYFWSRALPEKELLIFINNNCNTISEATF